ncbi:sodium:proton antiporter [Chloroflexus aggregans]|jgi:multicomponent Na+:H+ antiporter subunit C|uniref:NADH-ubiquinone oxidoreductase chain 4L n=1 Tax=Chloroflexus aggregans (strain MD-66 / DSM 9485) TaxID=326427 RepID=B8G651_CHLAD|nr:NADH-quinone oxidoreductase subunit K [Chloroflexus aggregans]ACL25784.1 NADH-ubiquinone oxidoreductase chain 4L [Chloroflexus aggregans DSM 9485]
MIILLAIAIGSLFGGATYLMLRRSVVKLILGLVMLSHGVNLLIFTMGDGVRRGAPPLVDANGQPPPGVADPLVQALILTAIVISFGFTAFVLALAYRSNQAVGSDDLDDLSTTDRL